MKDKSKKTKTETKKGGKQTVVKVWELNYFVMCLSYVLCV